MQLTLQTWTQRQIRHGGGPGAFAHQSDPPGISTELVDILVHPIDGGQLVLEPEISRNDVVLGAEESEHVQAVLHGDKRHPLVDEIVDAARGIRKDEGTAVDPNHHGHLGGGVGVLAVEKGSVDAGDGVSGATNLPARKC